MTGGGSEPRALRPALRRALGAAAALSGAATIALALLLIADGVVERGRAASETRRIERLDQAVLTEAGVAGELDAERTRQTERSVARDDRNHRLGWALLVASALFVAAAKGVQALGGAGLPTGGETVDLVSLGRGSLLSTAATGRSGTRPPVPAVELEFVDKVVAREGRGREAAIPILQALQSHYRYLPLPALRRVCELTEVTPAELVGVASFYSQFRSTPAGRHLVRLCHGTACHVAGIEPIANELRRRLEIPGDRDSDAELRFTLDAVNCLGCCSLAPVMMVDDRVAGRLTPVSACEVLVAAEAET